MRILVFSGFIFYVKKNYYVFGSLNKVCFIYKFIVIMILVYILLINF